MGSKCVSYSLVLTTHRIRRTAVQWLVKTQSRLLSAETCPLKSGFCPSKLICPANFKDENIFIFENFAGQIPAVNGNQDAIIARLR